jgi:hypothetical protein
MALFFFVYFSQWHSTSALLPPFVDRFANEVPKSLPVDSRTKMFKLIIQFYYFLYFLCAKFFVSTRLARRPVKYCPVVGRFARVKCGVLGLTFGHLWCAFHISHGLWQNQDTEFQINKQITKIKKISFEWWIQLISIKFP